MSEILPFPDSPRERDILRQRAVRLACETDPHAAAPMGELFLAVRLGPRERYGIPYRWLDEIVRPRGLTPVPGTPAFVAGVMARRGRLIAILDLARLLRLEGGDDDVEARIVMVSAAGLSVGLRVNEVIGNDRYDADALDPVPPNTAAIGNHWMTGIHAGQLTMLDLAALLGDPGIRIKEQT